MIVLWRVSNHCNLACPFCAYDKRLGLPREEADPAQVARLIDLLGAFRSETGRPVLLSWLGGEPLLWAPRAELDERAAGQGVGLSLTTNGTRLDVRVRPERRYDTFGSTTLPPATHHSRHLTRRRRCTVPRVHFWLESDCPQPHYVERRQGVQV